jgi:hypothetical protein
MDKVIDLNHKQLTMLEKEVTALNQYYCALLHHLHLVSHNMKTQIKLKLLSVGLHRKTI